MPHVLHWMKSVYGKSQPVIGGKLFSLSWGSVWTSTGSSRLDYSGKNPNRGGGGWGIEFPGLFKK